MAALSITSGYKLVGGACVTTAFSPLILICTLWLRSDLGITLNAGAVASWADQSGHSPANDFAQPVALSQPPWNAVSGANGFPGVTFGGPANPESLNGPPIGNFLSASAWATFTILKPITITLDGAIGFDNDGVLSDAVSFWGTFLRNNAGVATYVAYENPALKGESVTATTGADHFLLAKSNAITIESRIDSGVEASGPSAPIGAVASAANIGAGVGGRFGNFTMTEVVVMNTNPFVADIENMRGYARRRYALPV